MGSPLVFKFAKYLKPPRQITSSLLYLINSECSDSTEKQAGSILFENYLSAAFMTRNRWRLLATPQ
jgi:hypothetical protein